MVLISGGKDSSVKVAMMERDSMPWLSFYGSAKYLSVTHMDTGRAIGQLRAQGHSYLVGYFVSCFELDLSFLWEQVMNSL